MLDAIVTFIGGATARLIVGHVFDALVKWQDTKAENDRIKLQEQIEEAQHKRMLEQIKVQADLGVKLIETKANAHIDAIAADSFLEAVKSTTVKTGISVIDAWNGAVRPLLATICICLWISAVYQKHFVLDEWDKSLMSLALGVFVGGRIHLKGG
jgi:DNA-binding helix-hairpin-helix protein with protein kinase domain